MQFDLQREHGIPLTDVPGRMPRRNGKKVHYSTVYRWAKKGVRGRVLESSLVGGIRYTSVEALGRFLAAEAASDAPSHLTAVDEVLNRAGV